MTDSGWRKRQIALDKKAENARELGLDYEPSMTKDEALKLALEALDIVKIHFTQNRHVNEAITAIKEALAQPAQEPVEHCEAGSKRCPVCEKEAHPEQEPVFKWHSVFQEMPVENSHLLFCFGVHVVEGSYTKNGWSSLSYGSAQPDFWAYFPPPPHHRRNQELYAMPTRRPWIELTDKEIWGTISRIGTSDSDVNPYTKLADARAIEAKLKEKNT